MRISTWPARVRAAWAIWASCGRCSGRSAITPSTRPGGSSGLISSGAEPQPPERAVAAVADAADRAADAAPALADRPHVDRVEGGDRRALRVGEHEHPLERVGRCRGRSTSALGTSRVTGTGHGVPSASRPVRRDRLEVGAGEEAGQRRERAGEQQLQVGELAAARRVRRRVAQHAPRAAPTRS